jgi:ectoine hydroxylase-related dioxygenase (phytanoyl-CoA dioxygenase family)
MSVRGDFLRDGFAILPYRLPSDRRDALVAALDDGLGPDPGRNAYGVLRNNIWRQIPAYREFLLDGDLPRAAAELLGEDVVVFQDNLIWKPPRTEHQVRWHQDYSYWPLSSPRGVTLWLALDDADADNGCLHYLPGTHREGERCPTDFVAGTNQPLRPDLPPLDAEARADRVVAVPMRAGELLAHDPLTWHMSPMNATDRHRRAWSLTILVESVSWDTGHAPHPFNWTLAPVNGTPVVGELFPRFQALRAGS